MPTLLEMASEIVNAHASTTQMTKEELIREISEVYSALKALEKGEHVGGVAPAVEEEAAPAVSLRKAFGRKEIICMVCGKGMKTLGRHLRSAHDMTPKEYRNQFGIPRTQPLAAKDYSESRKQMAIDRGLGENLARARAAKGQGKAGVKGSTTKKAAAPGNASAVVEE
jgi:predicted transcriptional regulator